MKAHKTRLSLLLSLITLITLLLLLQYHTGAEAVSPPPTLSNEVASYPPPPGSVVVTQTGAPCTTYSFQVTTTAAGPYNGTFTATGTFTLEPMTPDPMMPNINYRVTAWTETFTINQPVTALPPQPIAHTINGTKQLDPTANSSGINVAQCSPTLVNPSPVFTTYQATIGGSDGTFTDSGTAQSGIVHLPSDSNSFFENFTSSQAATTPAPSACTAIAFTSNRDGNNEIYKMNPDGSNQTRLTNNTALDYTPAISPDGSRIAFATDRDGNQEIYVMNADSTSPVRLTNDPAIDYFPSWSPNGSKIAFTRDTGSNSEIIVMNADGTGAVNITNNPASDIQPVWSPDGTRIAYASNRDGQFYLDIYVMNADGTGATRLTTNFNIDYYPAWSPDGTKIAFSSDRPTNPQSYLSAMEIFVMNADGTNQTNLTNNGRGDANPAWSPDGSRIAFISDRDTAQYQWQIYTMNADGSGATRLTNTTAADYLPAWGACAANAPADQDHDGVPDATDNCPATANPNQLDTDHDGVGDACEQCPNDAAKLQPGACGCGVPDTDSDGDGTPDCLDSCPNDPGKVNPGACGCGVPDIDSDNDGLANCLDQCPTDPNKISPGTCGCGVTDTDSDSDGIANCQDNCPLIQNPDQRDTDGDGTGDVCTPHQLPSRGLFVIGDKVNLSPGATVYFWGSQWSMNNPRSGGFAPDSFKGFEDGQAGQPVCGGSWTSKPGNSSNPPPTVPEYMAVIVSSSIQKNGSVLTGDIKAIVIIRTNSGYGPAPGLTGTGRVVAILCGQVNASASLLDNLLRTQEPLAMGQGFPWLKGEDIWSPGIIEKGERVFGFKPVS